MCNLLESWNTVGLNLTFAQLANVQTVGIGLYIALAFIQAISSTGVAGLSRRVGTLRNAVAISRLGSVEAANIRRLSGEVGGLEIGFHALNRALLWTVFFLFLISAFYFAYCTVNQSRVVTILGAIGIFSLYLVVPVVIFVGSTAMIAQRCRKVSIKVLAAERRIQLALFRMQ